MKKIINIILISTILFFVGDTFRRGLQLELYNDGRLEKSFGLGECPFYPDKAMRFILDNNLPPNMFNAFNYGHYIIWNCYPKQKVFMDGRAGLYTPTGVLRLYPNVYMFKDVFKKVVKDYNINFFVLQTQTAGYLHQFLHRSLDWKMVYFSPIVVIYLKNTPSNQSLIQKHEVDLDDWPKKLKALKAINTKYYGKVKPEFISLFNDAKLLNALGKVEYAKFAFAEAIRLNPDIVAAYVKLANIYTKQGNFELSQKILLMAQKKGLKSKALLTNLGYTYERMGDLEKAERLYQKAASKWGAKPVPEAYSNLSRLYFERGLYRKALDYISEAVAFAPNNHMNHYTQGTIYISTGRYKEGKDSLERAVKLGPGHAESWNNLAVCYFELGQKGRARVAALTALDLNPQMSTSRLLLERIK